MTEPPKLPKALEAIADIVLAYKPKKAKAKAAKKRKKASLRDHQKKTGH